jgi:hypothetical protein
MIALLTNNVLLFIYGLLKCAHRKSVASAIRDPHAENMIVNGIIFTYYFKNFVLTAEVTE